MERLNNHFVAGLLVALCLAPAAATQSATLRVGPGQRYVDLLSAVEAARDGDTIALAAGRLKLRSEARIQGKAIRITGTGRESTVIEMREPIRCDIPGDTRPFFILGGGTLTLENLTVAGFNGPVLDAGIVCTDGSTVHLDNCRVYDNKTHGLVVSNDSTATIRNSRIDANGAFGVSVHTRGSATLEAVTVSGNQGTGLVVNSDSSAHVFRSTFSGNGGGGLSLGGGARADVTNSLIVENRAVRGGGVRLWGGGVHLVNSTVSGNQSKYEGGGIYIAEGSASVRNSIVYFNGGESIVIRTGSAEVTSSVIAGSSVWPGSRNSNEDPQFSSRTGTTAYRLSAFSPCVDAGSQLDAPHADRDGNARPCGGGIDLGAYEIGDCGAAVFADTGAPFERGNVDEVGAINLSDGVFLVNYLFLNGPEPTCLDAGDADDNGRLDLSDGLAIFGSLLAPTFGLGLAGCKRDATADALECRAFGGCR